MKLFGESSLERKCLTNYSKGVFLKKKKRYFLDLAERKESTSQVGGAGKRGLEAGGNRKLIAYRGGWGSGWMVGDWGGRVSEMPVGLCVSSTSNSGASRQGRG